MENETINTEIVKDNQSKTLSTPVAIIIAGIIIALAVIFSNGGGKTKDTTVGQNLEAFDQTKDLDSMRVITQEDHIRGNPDAPVKIVEYSDTECPFCKRFHLTMKQIMDEYGSTGQVAWVYRHFPIDQLHSKARKEAIATECAAEIGGNDAFWAYTDRLYEITPSNDGLDLAELPKIAVYVGLDVNKFNTCLTSGKHDQAIQDDELDAQATGGNGTPWSIVVSKSGKKYPLSGALPYESIKQLIELALEDK